MDLGNDHHEQQQFRNQQLNSGLLRFRSAPSSCDNSDSERLFSRFMNSSTSNDSDSFNFHDFEGKSTAHVAVTRADVMTMSGGVGGSQMSCRSDLPPQYPRQSSYGAVNSMKTTANLVRQNSSPAGIFSDLNSQHGYDAKRGIENPRRRNYREVTPSISRLGLLSQTSKTIFSDPVTSWNDDSALFVNEDDKLFSNTQDDQARVLSHHLSLPKTSIEMAALEKLMQFQDSVPCKIRAKRGCATHPRSIAERVRRTRISERMRKLQELVPNMEKQTNTADMLDLAVEYIKDLQRQFKTLGDNRAKCKCSNTQKSIPNQNV